MLEKQYKFLDKDLLPQPNINLQDFLGNFAKPQTYDDLIKLIEANSASFLKFVVPISTCLYNERIARANNKPTPAVDGLVVTSLPFLDPQAENLDPQKVETSVALLCAKVHAHKIIEENDGEEIASSISGLKRCIIV